MESRAALYSKLSQIDQSSGFGEEDWEDEYAGVELSVLIAKANSSIDLSDYLEQDGMDFVLLNSASGWTKKTFCPFHKNGHERTPSFFINSIKNIFYCQACGVSGGLTEFLSLKNKCSLELAAQHILSLQSVQGAAFLEERAKLNNRKAISRNMIALSELFREFIVSHKDDDNAFKYVKKAMEGFDSLLLINKEQVENNIEEILKNLKKYLTIYDSTYDRED